MLICIHIERDSGSEDILWESVRDARGLHGRHADALEKWYILATVGQKRDRKKRENVR